MISLQLSGIRNPSVSKCFKLEQEIYFLKRKNNPEESYRWTNVLINESIAVDKKIYPLGLFYN